MKKDKSFLGEGWAFPPGFSKESKTAITVAEEEDIQQSLAILLSTRIGERMMQPQYGCNLQDMVFERADRTAITLLKDTIETAILYHEPRIRLLEIKVNEDQASYEGKITLVIIYLVRSTNTRSNFVYPHYLTEASGFY